MGWLFPYNARTKADVLEAVLRENALAGNKVVDYRVVGNNLWTVIQIGSGDYAGKRAIILYLLSCRKGEWGYKDVDEIMQPFQLDCPLSFLGIATDFADDPGSAKWREGVRAFHAKKKALAAITLIPGTEVAMSAGLCALEAPYRKGYWVVRRLSDGARFRARIKDLREVIAGTVVASQQNQVAA